MDKKSLYLCLILFVVSLVVGYGAGLIVNVFNDNDVIVDEENENNDDNLSDENINEDNINDDDEVNTDEEEDDDYVVLEQLNETYSVNNLVLNFIGTKSSLIDDEGMYEYTLDISIDNKKVDSSIFGNKNKKVIWSIDHAASFRVVDVDNYYILVSSIAKQNDGSYVLIIDKKGNFVKKFEDVSISIDENNLEIEITDCESDDLDADCSTNRYKLSELK